MEKIVSLAVEASFSALEVAMGAIRPYQCGERTVKEVEIKIDRTLVTQVDREAALVARATLRARLGEEVDFLIEDLDGSSQPSKKRFWLFGDLLDGTNAFVCGLPTSTVGIGVYDSEVRELVAATIGEPATGRIWTATKGEGSFLFTPGGERRKLKTWDGTLEKPTVFLDVSHGFTRGDRIILLDEQMEALFSWLARPFKVLMPGSNLLQQALVAMGGEGCVGAVMTAKGGNWDAIGVLLALEAGGAAKAFRVSEGRQMEEKNPLDVDAYDILIVGNNEKTVNTIAGFFVQLF